MQNHLASAATLCLILSLLFAQHRAYAQAFDADSVTCGTLILGEQSAPLLNTTVQMTVSGLLVRTSLTQSFKNDTPNWQEGIYVFPLPDDASVDTLQMILDTRTIRGVIKTRPEAAKEYKKAMVTGKRASLIEQQRANLFSTRVANIPPGETIQISIAYQSSVRYDDGAFSLRFPLTMTPRYIPGATLTHAEPLQDSIQTLSSGWSDMTGISPPVTATHNAAQTSITVQIDAGIPLQSISSSSHSIISNEFNAPNQPFSRWQVQLADTAVPMDRDFTLSWIPPLGQAPRAAVFREDSVTPNRDAAEETSTATHSTYASVMLLPPQQLFDGDRTAREVIFVIDTSGSMQGNSIVQARKALSFGISRLSDQDTFNVIEFDDDARLLFGRATPATPAHQATAIDWINQLRADGGTEIATAMRMALSDNLNARETDGKRLRQVVFVTDGSVGNEEEIFSYIKHHLAQSRLFTVGIGSAPNTWFMRKAAMAGRGSYTSIANVREVQSNMLKLFNKLERPVLTDITVDVLGAPAPERYPATIPDLYAGEPIVADMHWNKRISDAELVVSGEHAGQTWSRKINLSASAINSGKLAKRFARAKIESLEDNRLFSARPDAISAQITQIALDYGLVTRYTSLIAVEEKVVRDPYSDSLTKSEIPAAMPFGNTMPFPQGSIGLVLRWILALMFSLLSVIFALATLYQVKNHAHH